MAILKSTGRCRTWVFTHPFCVYSKTQHKNMFNLEKKEVTIRNIFMVMQVKHQRVRKCAKVVSVPIKEWHIDICILTHRSISMSCQFQHFVSGQYSMSTLCPKALSPQRLKLTAPACSAEMHECKRLRELKMLYGERDSSRQPQQRLSSKERLIFHVQFN